MADDVDLQLDEGNLGNRGLSLALGVLVVLSLLVLGYYYQRPAGSDPLALPAPSGSPSPRPEVLPPPVQADVIKVYVAGEVKKPGVVSLAPGSRVEDAIAKAGGMTERADPLAINLASRLKDEQMVVVPARGQAAPSPAASIEVPGSSEESPPAPQEASPPSPTSGTDWSQYLDGRGRPARVSLNRASLAELEALPGVGPTTAADIVAYRKQHPFQSVDQLLEVPGIGDKKLEGMRPYIEL